MWLAAVLASGLSGDPQLPALDAFTAEVDRIVLAGRQMPPALLLDVARLPSAGDRMLALVYLRRSGLLTGPAVSLDQVVFQAKGDTGQTSVTAGAVDED